MALLIKKAKIRDIKAIYSLLNHYTEQGEILPRSLSELYDQIRDFFICVDEKNDTQVLGICAMHICWEDIAEIRSLAVYRNIKARNWGASWLKRVYLRQLCWGFIKFLF